MEIISVTKTVRMCNREHSPEENHSAWKTREEGIIEERNVSNKDKYSFPSFNHVTFCMSEIQINLNKEIILKTFNYVNIV